MSDTPQLSEEGQRLSEDHAPRVVPAGWTVVGPGMYRHIHRKLVVIFSAERERDGKRWLHLSVSQRDRQPTWDELREVKCWVFGHERVAVQVLPRESEYVNIHPNVLHLWHCLDGDPVPDFRHGGLI